MAAAFISLPGLRTQLHLQAAAAASRSAALGAVGTPRDSRTATCFQQRWAFR